MSDVAERGDDDTAPTEAIVSTDLADKPAGLAPETQLVHPTLDRFVTELLAPT